MIIDFYVEKSCDIYSMVKIRFNIFVRKMISDLRQRVILSQRDAFLLCLIYTVNFMGLYLIDNK